MDKDLLLLLHESIKTEKENTEMLFKNKVNELREYQKQTIDRVENVKREFFPKEIHDMMMRVFKNENRCDSYWENLNIININASLFISDNRVSSVNYKRNQIINGTLEKTIYNNWCLESYVYKIEKYKNDLDLINDFLDSLIKNIHELYSYIAHEVNKMQEEKRKSNNRILQSFNSLEKEISNKEKKKVKIIIEVEDI